jgi:hypothetical protein
MNLEQLLRERPFEALSLHERAEVLTEMSAEEYRRVREVALLADRALSHGARLPQPRPETQALLRSRLQDRKRSTSQIRQLLDYRMPVWQAAAAAMLLVFTLHWAQKSPGTLPQNQEASVLLADSTSHDSAFRTSFDPQEDTILARMDREADTL